MRPARPLLVLAALMVLAPRSPIVGDEGANLDDAFGRLGRAIAAIQDPEDRGYELMRLAALRARAGDRDAARGAWDRAAATVAEVPGEQARYSDHLLTWIARSQIEAEDFEAARAILDRALRIAQAMPDGPRKLQMLRQIIILRRDARDPGGVRAAAGEARRLIDSSHDPSLAPRRPIARIELLALAGGLREALTMLIESEPPKGMDFDRFRYEALLPIVLMFGPPRGIEDRALMEAAEAAERQAGRPAPPRGVEDRALLEEEIRPLAFGLADGYLRNQILLWVVQAELNLGLLEKARETALSIDPGAVPLHAFEGALVHKALAFAAIADAQARARDRAGVRATVEEIVRLIAEVDPPSLKTYPLERASRALAVVGETERARKLLDSIDPNSPRAGDLAALAAIRRRAGDQEAARALLRRALADAEAPARDPGTGPPPRRRPPDEAARARQAAFVQALIPRLEAQLGDLGAADRHFRALPPGADRDNVAAAIAAARAGDLAAAWAWAEALDPPRTRVRALAAITEQLVPARPGPLGAAAGPP